MTYQELFDKLTPEQKNQQIEIFIGNQPGKWISVEDMKSKLKYIWDEGVKWGDANSEFGGETLLPKFEHHLNIILPPQSCESHLIPKNDKLEELEKWVNSAFVEKVGGERVFNATFLLSKIQELKNHEKK